MFTQVIFICTQLKEIKKRVWFGRWELACNPSFSLMLCYENEGEITTELSVHLQAVTWQTSTIPSMSIFHVENVHSVCWPMIFFCIKKRWTTLTMKRKQKTFQYFEGFLSTLWSPNLHFKLKLYTRRKV